MCEPKRRHLQKSEKWVQNGHIVFRRFYEIHQRTGKPKTYEEFCDSSYYNAFVKFGRYMMHTNPLYPEKYIDYVILSRVKLDHWSRDDLYEQYLKDTLKTESVEAALRRSIATMMDWATEQNVQWADYFRLVNTSRAVQHIQSGHISPWLILGCDAGKKCYNHLRTNNYKWYKHILIQNFGVTSLKTIRLIIYLYKKQRRRHTLSKVDIAIDGRSRSNCAR